MKYNFPRLACTLLALLSVPSFVLGQANVNEGLETATLYVDGTKGSDSNPGTSSLPLKTIGAAVTLADTNNFNSVGTRVVINPGTYREALNLSFVKRNTSLPMTFQAATNGTVFVSGADVWTGWATYNGNPQIYTHNWPYQYGVCSADAAPAPMQQQIMLRREMVAVGGVPLTQVLTLSAMQPGTFYVNEASALLYVRPAAGTDMSTAKVEVSTRPTLFALNQASNVVLRGLTFQYSNACHQNGAVVVYGSNNILFDHDTFVWNNSVGAFFQSSQSFTVQNSVANHNGQTGFYTSTVKNNLWQSDTASYNNWRGAQGAFYGWDTGGGKFMFTHSGTFKQLSTNFNQTAGIHFDTDDQNITVSSLVHANNVMGFELEKSQGPTSVTGSYFCGSGMLGLTFDGGFVVRNSPSLTLTGNQIVGNYTNQIAIIGVAGGILVTNWETGATQNLFTEKMTSTSNTISGNAASQVFRDSYLGGTDWTLFETTLNSNKNSWWADTNTTSFTTPLLGKQHHLGLPDWQALTAQDALSTWTKTSEPAQCMVSADGPDYWLISGNINGVKINSAHQATFTLNTVALGGMTGNVSLTATGLSSIPGAKASLSPATISTNTTSVLTVTTTTTTPSGKYPVTVVANVGNVTRTVTLMLIVP